MSASDPDRPAERTMTTSPEESRHWMDTVGDWLWARWRWLIAGVALLFALNNLAGLVVGSLGLIAFLNGVLGRVLKAKRVVQQVQRMVTRPDDPAGEAGPERRVDPPDHRS